MRHRTQGRTLPVKAKQSPMVDRQREKSTESSASSSSIGALKLPKRLALNLPTKRPDLFHDATAESPCKRMKCSPSNPFDDCTPSPENPACMLAVPTGGARSSRGPMRGPVRAMARDIQQQAKPRPELLSELKAKLRERQQASDRTALTSASGIVSMGLKELHERFVGWVDTFANFTSEILRDDSESEDSDDWRWVEHSKSPSLTKSSRGVQAEIVGVTPPHHNHEETSPSPDRWDDDPWAETSHPDAAVSVRIHIHVRVCVHRLCG